MLQKIQLLQTRLKQCQQSSFFPFFFKGIVAFWWSKTTLFICLKKSNKNSKQLDHSVALKIGKLFFFKLLTMSKHNFSILCQIFLTFSLTCGQLFSLHYRERERVCVCVLNYHYAKFHIFNIHDVQENCTITIIFIRSCHIHLDRQPKNSKNIALNTGMTPKAHRLNHHNIKYTTSIEHY